MLDVPREQDSKWYAAPSDEYFMMCQKIAKSYGISPKDVYETWELPMLIITYVNLHNAEITEYGIEQDYAAKGTRVVISPHKEYIYNVTGEDIANSEDDESRRKADEDDAIAMLRRMYEGR